MSFLIGPENIFINCGKRLTYFTNVVSAVVPPPAYSDFVFVWGTQGDAQTLTLPLIASGTYDFSVDWGDGSPVEQITDYTLGYHEYATTNTYSVTINGQCTRWDFFAVPTDADKVPTPVRCQLADSLYGFCERLHRCVEVINNVEI